MPERPKQKPNPPPSPAPSPIFEYKPGQGPNHSPTLCPNEHVRAIVELLRPATPDLARRWLAALTLVPINEREQVVEQIEQRIVELYTDDRHPDDRRSDESPGTQPDDKPRRARAKPR